MKADVELEDVAEVMVDTLLDIGFGGTGVA